MSGLIVLIFLIISDGALRTNNASRGAACRAIYMNSSENLSRFFSTLFAPPIGNVKKFFAQYHQNNSKLMKRKAKNIFLAPQKNSELSEQI